MAFNVIYIAVCRYVNTFARHAQYAHGFLVVFWGNLAKNTRKIPWY